MTDQLTDRPQVETKDRAATEEADAIDLDQGMATADEVDATATLDQPVARDVPDTQPPEPADEAAQPAESAPKRRSEPADAAVADGAVAPSEAALPALVERSTGRDAHLDNVKFVAIALVVVGHLWGPMLAWSQTLLAAYLLLYTVHMPIFVLLSGYFSRHFTASPRQARSLVRSVVAPYLIVETGFCLFRYFGDDQQLEFALQDPWWVTWFLVTLFFWRLSAPLWRVVRFPIVLAVAISLAAGSQQLTETFELGRLLQYLPFFVLGMSLRREHFEWLRTRWARIAAVPVLAGAFYLAYVFAPMVSVEWVYWRLGNDELDVTYPVFAGVKLLQLAATVLVIAAVIALVPTRRLPILTAFGAVSMFAYLLHGFVAKGAEWWGFYDHPFIHTHLGIAVVTLGSVALTFVLCSPPVQVLFSWAVQPKLDGWMRGGAADR
ncbi:MAG: acyltransferase family protein [Streptosporangiales bacterium]|nr:acyltransferase family protein [Streptosporangiales bacterium]